MESTITAEKELLRSFKRLCTKKNCFRNVDPDGELWALYRSAIKLIDEELESPAATDMDKVEAIASDLLIVICNADLHFSTPSRKRQSGKIASATTKVDCDSACHYLDDRMKITIRHKADQKRMEKLARVNTFLLGKGMRIFNRLLSALIIIGLALCLLRFIFPLFPDPSNDKSIAEKISYCWKHTLLKESQPISLARRLRPIGNAGGIVAITLGIVLLIEKAAFRTIHVISQRKHEPVERMWNDYQNIRRAFEAVSEQINGLEW